MTRKNMFYWQSDRPFTALQIKEIFLDRKNDYNKQLISRAAAQSIGKNAVTLSSPIDFGSVNIVCPFNSENNMDGIIRVHPPEVTNKYFFAEAEAMKLANSVGVPVPNTILVDTSREQFPFDYMVTSKINGSVMQTMVEGDPNLYSIYLKQIGRYLGKLHTLHTTKYGFFDNNKAKSGKLEGTLDSNEEHYNSAIDLDEKFYMDNPNWIDKKIIEEAIRILRSKIAITRCDTPTLIHNDIADWNTIVHENKVTGILDWDECFSGDPIFEFATMSLFYSNDKMDIIKEGYSETNVLPLDYDKKFNLYVLRYIINKSKISIKKLQYLEKESTRNRFNLAKEKLSKLVKLLA